MDTRHNYTHTDLHGRPNVHTHTYTQTCMAGQMHTHIHTHKHINVITWVMYRAHFRIIHIGHLSGTFKDFLCVISDNNS